MAANQEQCTMQVQWQEPGTEAMKNADTKSSLFVVTEPNNVETANIKVIELDGSTTSTETGGLKLNRAYGGMIKGQCGASFRQVPCMFFALDKDTLEIQTADRSSLENAVREISDEGFVELDVVARIATGYTMDLAQVAEESGGDDARINSFLSKKLGNDATAYSQHLKNLPKDHEFYSAKNGLRPQDVEELEAEAKRLLSLVSDDHDEFEFDHPNVLYPPQTPMEERFCHLSLTEQRVKNNEFDKLA